jgi:hypothetical protein
MLDHVGGKLGHTEPRPEDSTLALAPLEGNPFDPAVDGADVGDTHPEGSALDGRFHDVRP